MRFAIRFHDSLNDFLAPSRKGKVYRLEYPLPVTVKDRVESLGVPHPEIGLILSDNSPVDFDTRLRDGDRLDVYPANDPLIESFPESARLTPKPPWPLRFILDTQLGKLSVYLHILGLDTLYDNQWDDAEIAKIARTEQRIILTRDIGLLKRGNVRLGYWVRMTEPKRQVLEILERFFGESAPDEALFFSRCPLCNQLLRPATPEEIAGNVPPLSRAYYRDFKYCVDCAKAYWKGHHYQDMIRSIKKMTAEFSK